MSDKLDHETESVIEEFAVEEWLSGKKMTNHASDARDALRQRIRVLVDEARKEGADTERRWWETVRRQEAMEARQGGDAPIESYELKYRYDV